MNNSKKFLRLTLGERKHIEQSLKARKSFRSIAIELQRSKDTISREVIRNSVFRQTGGFGKPFNNCVHRGSCDERNLCSYEDCRRDFCCGCKFCIHVCNKYERESCIKIKSPPYVCNACQIHIRCTLEKVFYDAIIADSSASSHLSRSRQGINLTQEELQRLDGIVSPLLKQGQSPWHICQTHKDEIMISDKTLYSYVSANLFEATNFDLTRKVKMKPRRKKAEIKIERSCREGRSYREFLDWVDQSPESEVVQMDTVMGAKGDGEKVLLTIHFPHSQFMLAYIRNANTARSVTEIFDSLKSTLGFNRFEEIFPVILTDNGSEFSNPSAIETDKDSIVWTKIYYCDPNCPYQKGSIEAGHRFIRRVLPKGQSINTLTQNDIELMMSHINSYSRNSLGGRTPLDVFSDIHGNKMAKILGVRPIPFNKINLTPGLIK